MTDRDAIETLKNYIESLMEDYGYYKDIVEFRDSVEHLEKTIQTQQEEIEKKDKIIDEMAEQLEKHSTAFTQLYGANAEDWKEYFINKVEKENKQYADKKI